MSQPTSSIRPSQPCLESLGPKIATAHRPIAVRRHQRSGAWCWLWAAVALLEWQVASAQSPAQPECVVIRGVVLNDSLNVPVPNLRLYLNHTKYGAVTNERGEFTLTFPTGWKPVRGGLLLLQAIPIPYTFRQTHVQVDWRHHDPAQLLTLHLTSAPGRGRPNLIGSILMAPPLPPPVYPPRARTIRP